MSMNIYITEENERLLQLYKASGKSMSGLVNALIMEHFNHPTGANSGIVEFRGDELLMIRNYYTPPTDAQLSKGSVAPTLSKKIASEATPGTTVLGAGDGGAPHHIVTDELSTRIKPDIPTAEPVELECCKMNAPCKHWAYDSGERQWKNSLSGRIKTVTEPA